MVGGRRRALCGGALDEETLINAVLRVRAAGAATAADCHAALSIEAEFAELSLSQRLYAAESPFCAAYDESEERISRAWLRPISEEPPLCTGARRARTTRTPTPSAPS